MDKQIPVGARFSIIGRAFKKELDSVLSREDITGVQFGVLVVLTENENCGITDISQHTLEEAVHVTHPTMTGIIKKLSAKGYISCRTAQADRRRNCISSTPKARDLVSRMDMINAMVWDKLSAGLSDERRELLLDSIDTMLGNICDCGKNERSDP